MSTITGTDAADHLSGTSEDDIISGGGGDDVLAGGDGDDLLEGGTGNDQVDGGAGFDTATVLLPPGTTGSFRFVFVFIPGQPFSQLVLQRFDGPTAENLFKVDISAGSVTLEGINSAAHLGRDTYVGVERIRFAVDGGDPDQALDWWIGDDLDNLITASAGTDRVDGFGGADVVRAGDGADTVDGGAGNDQLYGEDGADVILGGNGDDVIDGGANGLDLETLNGDAGNDIIYGGVEDDGVDFIRGGIGNDTAYGGGGDDALWGDAGDDLIFGEAGDDVLLGGVGADVMDGGEGFDRASYFGFTSTGVTVSLLLQGHSQNTGPAGVDTLIGIEHLWGTAFSDTLIGDDGDNWIGGSQSTFGTAVNNDRLIGNGGSDVLVATGTGNHVFDGGIGSDTAGFTGQLGVTLSLALQGQAQNSGRGNWTLGGIENLTGTAGADSLTGDALANLLAGAGGNDTLIGGDGNDSLFGDGEVALALDRSGTSGAITTFQSGRGSGADVLDGGAGDDLLIGGGNGDQLTGGAGRDTFAFLATSDSAPGAADLIIDFEPPERMIAVDANGVGPARRPTTAELLERTGGHGKGLDNRRGEGGDVIDLSAIDADSTTDGDQAFALVRDGFTGQAGEAFLQYDEAADLSRLFLDVDGNGVADMVINFGGDITSLPPQNIIF